MSKTKVGICGGAGYTGGELLRLLLAHPKVEVAAVSSKTFTGKPIHKAHPNLRGGSGLVFTDQVDTTGLDCLFLAEGHGSSMAHLPDILKKAGAGMRVIDLSGDFRLKDPELYPAWYGRVHSAPRLLKGFVYGLPELDKNGISKAAHVANPGCFATAMILALGPLAAAKLSLKVSVTAITGSSGSGALPSTGTHHPAREGNLKAYKPLSHQHVPEAEQFFDGLAGGPSLRLSMVPISGPFVRGIYAVCQAAMPEGWDMSRIAQLYKTVYHDCRFVRITEEPPELKAVTGSNYCDLHLAGRDGSLTVIAALDNLVKGAAGQAVQNFNLMMGWDDSEGLEAQGVYP